jgi:outer membrane receptor protein involved in Fe transport
MGVEREEVDVDNLFAQNSEGSYVFDSVADLQNATASGLLYNNAITNNENDLRAIWGYDYQSLYIQDSWNVSADLEVDFGVRYDKYSSNGSIRANSNFEDRYGYSNTKDIDGLDVILPGFLLNGTSLKTPLFAVVSVNFPVARPAFGFQTATQTTA